MKTYVDAICTPVNTRRVSPQFDSKLISRFCCEIDAVRCPQLICDYSIKRACFKHAFVS